MKIRIDFQFPGSWQAGGRNWQRGILHHALYEAARLHSLDAVQTALSLLGCFFFELCKPLRVYTRVYKLQTCFLTTWKCVITEMTYIHRHRLQNPVAKQRVFITSHRVSLGRLSFTSCLKIFSSISVDTVKNLKHSFLFGRPPFATSSEWFTKVAFLRQWKACNQTYLIGNTI